tara:strand:- start:27 stop:437 length:411 start_codon:yes stop_codon:yes gene_type:complete
MSHFAKVVNNIVTQVIVAEQDWVDSLDGEWVQTSYNTQGGAHSGGKTPLRKNYAGVGDTYDSTRDAFYAPQPYPSWTLNESSCMWEAPTPKPTVNDEDCAPAVRKDGTPILKEDGTPVLDYSIYLWDEDTLSWIEQ